MLVWSGDMELDPLFADSDGAEDVDVVEPSSSWVRYPAEEPESFQRPGPYTPPWQTRAAYYNIDPFDARRKRALETDAFLKPKKSNERQNHENPGPSSMSSSDVTRQVSVEESFYFVVNLQVRLKKIFNLLLPDNTNRIRVFLV